MAWALSLALAALLFAGSGLTEKEVAEALGGKVPARSEVFTAPSGKVTGRGLGAIVIDRPVDEIWRTLVRFEDRAAYVPRLLSVAVLARAGSRVRVRQEVDASVKKVRYTAWFEIDERGRTIHWTLDRTAGDNGIKDVDGEYRLFEIDAGRSLLVYRTWLDPGLAVPEFIQRYMAVKSIPNLLGAIKQRVESGGTWRKR
jgi:hypothetical protein